MSSVWELPGPRRFVRDVADDLRGGSSVVLRFGSAAPDGLLEQLNRSCVWGFSWNTVEADSDRHPLSVLRRSPAVVKQRSGVRSVLDLARDEHFQERLIWVRGLRPAAWPKWRMFLRSYSDASRNHVLTDRRTTFVVPLCGSGFDQAELSEVAVVNREFRDVVHRDDLYIFAVQHSERRKRRRVIRSLLAHTVAHVACFDHALAERLLEADVHLALKPWPILRAYAQERGWSVETAEDWAVGTIDGPRRRPTVHSALLFAKKRQAELSRRLWAAQAAVLMPLLEERRTELINRYRNHFDLPFETELERYEKPEDLELGPLVHYFHRHGPPNRRAMGEARQLRHLRNKLAHIVPLEPNEALHPLLLGASPG